MRKCLLAVAAMAAVSLGLAGMASAATVTLAPTSGGGIATATPTYSGFITWTGLAAGPGDYLGTIIDKEFTGLGTLVLDVDFAGLDLNYALRWVENITNSTGVAWTDYHLKLSDTGGWFFGDVNWGSPSLVTIGAGPSHPSVTIIDISQLTLSDDKKRIDIAFANPVAPGSSFAIYTPIVNVGSAPGSFTLAQHPTVPLPAAAWGGMALLGGIGAIRAIRHRKQA